MVLSGLGKSGLWIAIQEIANGEVRVVGRCSKQVRSFLNQALSGSDRVEINFCGESASFELESMAADQLHGSRALNSPALHHRT
jgi:hypothetical protein